MIKCFKLNLWISSTCTFLGGINFHKFEITYVSQKPESKFVIKHCYDYNNISGEIMREE